MNIQDQITGAYVTPLITAEKALVKTNERRKYFEVVDSQLNKISKKINYETKYSGAKNIKWKITSGSTRSLLDAVEELVKAGYLILDNSFKPIDTADPSWPLDKEEIIISWELDRKEEE
jgi:hypothetical protein